MCENASPERLVWIDIFAVRQWPGKHCAVGMCGVVKCSRVSHAVFYIARVCTCVCACVWVCFGWCGVFSHTRTGNHADLDFRGVIRQCNCVCVCMSTHASLSERFFITNDRKRDAYTQSETFAVIKRSVAFFRLWCVVGECMCGVSRCELLRDAMFQCTCALTCVFSPLCVRVSPPPHLPTSTPHRTASYRTPSELAAAVQYGVPVIIKAGQCTPTPNPSPHQTSPQPPTTPATMTTPTPTHALNTSGCVAQMKNLIELTSLSVCECTVAVDYAREMEYIHTHVKGGIETVDRMVHGALVCAAASARLDVGAVEAAVCGEHAQLEALLREYVDGQHRSGHGNSSRTALCIIPLDALLPPQCAHGNAHSHTTHND